MHSIQISKTAIISVSVGSSSLLLLLLILLYVCKRRKQISQQQTTLTIFCPLIKRSDLAFLQKKDGLASLGIIGKGGCGEVHKAKLPRRKGKMIAIKKIIQPRVDAAELTDADSFVLNKKVRQIHSEIQTIGQIRHKNLLPLLAHVARPDSHYLVYEFMKNGSLQDMMQQISDGNREVDWLVRHKIALGIAEGLEYLHMHHDPQIIHRDLKPGNILLDDNLEARISDFGLAKEIPNAETHITFSNVAGTFGYIAPDYYQTLKFTDKSDIYSFGVILAVLVMGKLPSDEYFQHTYEMNPVVWLKNVMASEDPKRAIDPKLIGNGFEEQMLSVLKIACLCTLDDPKKRPNSKDVRCMLTQKICLSINHAQRREPTVLEDILATMEGSVAQPTNANMIRLESFDGENFTRWQEKLLFFLTSLKLAYILKDDLEEIPEPEDDDSQELKNKRQKREEDEYLCRGHILNSLSAKLYSGHRNIAKAKDIWVSLETKYQNEEASNRKFLITNYMDFKMSNDKSIVAQAYELQNIASDLENAGIKLVDEFQVGVLVSKLPSTWNGYKKKLKHDDITYTYASLLRHLRIEEESRNRDKKGEQTDEDPRANMVEGKSKHTSLKPSQDKNFKKNSFNKKNKKCYFCDKPGHFARDCRLKKKATKDKEGTKEANNVEYYVATVYEANTVETDNGWWLDTGASIHICKDRSLFKTYQETGDEKVVKMGNVSTSKVLGNGTVDLKFTSGKVLTLVDVFHVPDMCKNLVSGDLLNKGGFKITYESDKLVLSKNGQFVGKGYSCNRMIKFNIINDIPSA